MHERGARLPLVCACVGCGAAKNINQLETLDKIDVILYMQYFRCWWLGFAHTEPRLPAKIQDTILFNHHRRRRRHWWQRRQHFRNDALREWWKRIWYARLLQSMPPMKGLWCAQKKNGISLLFIQWKYEKTNETSRNCFTLNAICRGLEIRGWKIFFWRASFHCVFADAKKILACGWQ